MTRGFISAAAVAALFALTGPATSAAPMGSPAQESPDQWRASKLVGVAIYGPNNTSVGKISDVLMTKDGKVEFVIVGVGGFLGIGEKDIAVPYDQVRFTDQQIEPPANPVPGNRLAPAADGKMAGAVEPGTAAGLGAPVDASGVARPMSATIAAAAAMTRSTAYPDHGVVDMTADQLKSAPPFSFAR